MVDVNCTKVVMQNHQQLASIYLILAQINAGIIIKNACLCLNKSPYCDI